MICFVAGDSRIFAIGWSESPPIQCSQSVISWMIPRIGCSTENGFRDLIGASKNGLSVKRLFLNAATL
jgi:uncharacterized protein (AIM24 family)